MHAVNGMNVGRSPDVAAANVWMAAKVGVGPDGSRRHAGEEMMDQRPGLLQSTSHGQEEEESHFLL